MPIACSIGIMAPNEEANVGTMLGALVSQRTVNVHLTEIVVVASGCTDRTVPNPSCRLGNSGPANSSDGAIAARGSARTAGRQRQRHPGEA